jgi:hypothetical protein
MCIPRKKCVHVERKKCVHVERKKCAKGFLYRIICKYLFGGINIMNISVAMATLSVK